MVSLRYGTARHGWLPFADSAPAAPSGLLLYLGHGWELWGIMSVSEMLVAGRYRLLKSLGSGGMGRVWFARDEVLRRDVAVKEVVLPADLSPEDREELCLRTLREARAAGRLSHPNVVQIYDVVETQGRPWIVMELIRSRSLYQVMKQDGPLPPRRVAEIGLFLLAALRAAHRAGVLHRDVKPGNVLLADDGRVVLSDFGLATFDGGDGSVTRSGLILGSAQYIAPERARDGASGPETDLWSLGATLYAAVGGTITVRSRDVHGDADGTRDGAAGPTAARRPAQVGAVGPAAPQSPRPNGLQGGRAPASPGGLRRGTRTVPTHPATARHRA